MEGCAKLEPETVEQITGVFTFKLQRIYATVWEEKKKRKERNPHS